MIKTRNESKEEAVEVMRLIRNLIHLADFLLITDIDHKCAVLKDATNNEEFRFSIGGELLDEQ